MDLGTLSVAYQGLKAAKDTISGLTHLKIEIDTLSKINDAAKQVGEAQDILFQMREELFRLQDENRDLKERIDEKEKWHSKVGNYALTKTDGGAIVYQTTDGSVHHYACPSCLEKKEIQILQDQRFSSGLFICPGCGKTFPVNISRRIGRRVISSGIE